jgi:hypothetical protein
MAVANFHISSFGSFASGFESSNGFVYYHDHPRYEKASDDQLAEWTTSRLKAVRNAAWAEINQRSLQAWRNAN